ncbi:MAG: aconitate hydratase, partial [Pseudonocardia sp.]|nr:aconitate hydratase [Pseudonocardia sp.]
YPDRARDAGAHAVVAGSNYGQGSSREHAAITPRYLGLAVVVARSYARIHWQNLANFGVLALEFTEPGDLDDLEPGTVLHFRRLHTLADSATVSATDDDGRKFRFRHRLAPRQVEAVLAGGRIPAHARHRSARDARESA